ncbi:hypothetical protein JCM15519_09720 [Fundidesulfovibrio butyratiphilus]
MRAKRFSVLLARLVLVGLALLCLAAAGCAAPKHVVRVESSGHPAKVGAKFLVAPGVMDAKIDDPKFQAVARQLAEFLVKKGYVQVTSYDQAELVVYLAYAVKGSVRPGHAPGGGFFAPMAAPSNLEAQTATGLHLSAEHEMLTASPLGSSPTAGFMGGGMFGMGRGGMGPEVRYDLSFLIEAMNLAKYKKNDPDFILWQVRVATSGLPEDIPRAMPYVLAAISDYIGKSAFLTLEVDEKMNVTVQRKPHPKP